MKKKFICLVIAISLLSTSCMQTVLAMDTQTPVSENENSENLEEGNESSDNLEKENDNTEQETTADISTILLRQKTPVKDNNLKTTDSTDPTDPADPSSDLLKISLLSRYLSLFWFLRKTTQKGSRSPGSLSQTPLVIGSTARAPLLTGRLSALLTKPNI